MLSVRRPHTRSFSQIRIKKIKIKNTKWMNWLLIPWRSMSTTMACVAGGRACVRIVGRFRLTIWLLLAWPEWRLVGAHGGSPKIVAVQVLRLLVPNTLTIDTSYLFTCPSSPGRYVDPREPTFKYYVPFSPHQYRGSTLYRRPQSSTESIQQYCPQCTIGTVLCQMHTAHIPRRSSTHIHI